MIDYKQLPQGESFESSFKSTKRMKKDLLKFRYFPEEDKYFVNIEILSGLSYLCALNECAILASDIKKGKYIPPFFIDSSWIINEFKGPIGAEMERLINEMRKNQNFHSEINRMISEC